MSAPQYRSRDNRKVVVQAIQFIEADPTTHWHVNVGDDISTERFESGFYVRSHKQEPVAIKDRDYVIEDSEGGHFVMSEADFEAAYEAVPERVVL